MQAPEGSYDDKLIRSLNSKRNYVEAIVRTKDRYDYCKQI